MLWGVQVRGVRHCWLARAGACGMWPCGVPRGCGGGGVLQGWWRDGVRREVGCSTGCGVHGVL